jgi:hypothetical protein
MLRDSLCPVDSTGCSSVVTSTTDAKRPVPVERVGEVEPWGKAPGMASVPVCWSNLGMKLLGPGAYT